MLIYKAKNKIKGAIAFLVSSFYLFLSSPVFAQAEATVEGIALASTEPRIIVLNIIRIVLGFLGLVAVVVILYGGFLWMTAAGNEDQIAKAKKVLINALIGLAIILASFSITQFFINSFIASTTGPPVEDGVPGGTGGGAFVFTVRRFSPVGSVPIMNVKVRAFFTEAIDEETLEGNLVVTRKDDGSEVEGTLTANERTREIEFEPITPCPGSNSDRLCFDGDTDFVIEAKTGLRSIDGDTLSCGGLASVCISEFRTGYQVDFTGPTVVITSPDSGEQVPVDTCVPVQARVIDNFGVSSVEFYVDGDLIEDGVAVAPEGDTTRELLLEIDCWPTQPPAPSSHTLTAIAYDIDANSGVSDEVIVMVRPLHCFNNVIDADETNIDCGGEDCGRCDNNPCTENFECAGGLCLEGQCVSPTTITGISPESGREGTFVTVAGRSFGGTRGTVKFFDNIEASAPTECGDAEELWNDNYALVSVPANTQDGPITIAKTGCLSDDLCRDSTNDERGPIIPNAQGAFIIDENILRPGICSATSPAVPPLYLVAGAQGGWGASVEISGVQFGEENGGVLFSGIATTGAVTWADTLINVGVPSIDYGMAQVQVVDRSGIYSNAIPYNVLSEDAATLPYIERIAPESAGAGSGITIYGRNFGARIGTVLFIAEDGTESTADTSLPEECGTGWWTETAITVKVPKDIDRGDYTVYVHRYDSQQSNREEFEVTNVPAGPFLACIRPLAGPLLTNTVTYGENLGNSANLTGDPATGIYFTSNSSSTILAFIQDESRPNPNWGKVGGALINNIQGAECPSDGWNSNKVCSQVSTLAATGQVRVDQQVGGVTRYSNPLSFTVGSCLSLETDSTHLDCSTLGNNLTCCPDGSCDSTCSDNLNPSSHYAWQFTTSQAPLIPEILTQCDIQTGDGHPKVTPSPSPSSDRDQGTEVCVNATVSVRLSTPVVDSTLNSNNIIIQECTSPENMITGANSTFAGMATIWGRPPVPDLGDVVVPSHGSHLQVGIYPYVGRTVEGDLQNHALGLRKLDDDVGPGWPNSIGVQHNNEHWFGYRANAISDTNGRSYTAEVYVRAMDQAPIGQKAGILIQRNGSSVNLPSDTEGLWQKAINEINLNEDWQRLAVSIDFDSGLARSATGYVRVYLKGDPHDVRGDRTPSAEPPPDPRDLYGIYVDDFQLIGDVCNTVQPVSLATGMFEISPDDAGFRWWMPSGFGVNKWYRVALLGGAGGIKAQNSIDQTRIGQEMEVTEESAERCGNLRASDCFVFKTRNNSFKCEVGGIAIDPNPWTANEENEMIDYSAIPVALGDRCITLNPSGYEWSWDVSDKGRSTTKAVVGYASGNIGKRCSSNDECLIGGAICSNDSTQLCVTDLDCGIGTCQNITNVCVSNYCSFMPWTATAQALQETGPENPVWIQSHIDQEAPIKDVTGRSDLFIEFEPPRINAAWPTCGEACLNGAIGLQFSRSMLSDSSNNFAVTNSRNIQLWVAPCGNGDVDPGEGCDDGNIISGDGCSSICVNEGTYPGSPFILRCGDGNIDLFEDCDNGRHCSDGTTCTSNSGCAGIGDKLCIVRDNDGCSDICLREGINGGTCGNGSIQIDSTTGLGEECDDGNNISGDGCSDFCLNEGTRSDLPICGNGRLDAGEECEASLDGSFPSWCRSPSQATPSLRSCLRSGPVNVLSCGNGVIDQGEECDRNSSLLNTPAKRDLCDSNCQWTGTRRPSRIGGAGCGDRSIDLGEDCDDGNLRHGDGCDEACRNEGAIYTTMPVCGNGVIDLGEDCDDGNSFAGDGCSDLCLNEGRLGAICGNSRKEVGEDCDDSTLLKCNSKICLYTIPNAGSRPTRVTNLSLQYIPATNELSIRPPEIAGHPGERLLPNTFYRVLIRGGDKGVFSCAGEGCARAGQMLDEEQMNFNYVWGSVAPSPANIVKSGGNTFTSSFNTKDVACQVDRIQVRPEDSSIYVIGSKRQYQSTPFGPPDSCDPQGQRLDSFSFNWGWDTSKPVYVADIFGTTGGSKGLNVIPGCGNEVVELGEDCDDGNNISGDGCSNICLNEGSNFSIACGDPNVDPGEECDRRDSSCTVECLNAGTLPCRTTDSLGCCGNGGEAENPELGEDCDDGNSFSGDGCSVRCLNEGSSISTTCGNNVIDEGEECDPGDTTTRINGVLVSDYCNPNTCLLKGSSPRSTCGINGIEIGEDCNGGEGCNSICLNQGSESVASSTCGNSILERGEDCDDGNATPGDGCSGICLNEGTQIEQGSQVKIDPIQLVYGKGIEKFCRPVSADLSEYFLRNVSDLTPCTSNTGCRDGEICSPPNPWSIAAVQASTQGVQGEGAVTVYCIANSDKDCPERSNSGNTAIGRGSDNCCYARPVISSRSPEDSATDVCTNALLRVGFSSAMDIESMAGNLGIARSVEGATCPEGTQTLDQQLASNTLFNLNKQSLFARIWNKVKSFVGRIIPFASAQPVQVWCVDPALTLNMLSATDGGSFVLSPSRVFSPKTLYKVVFIGDRDLNDIEVAGIKSVNGVGFHPAGSNGVDDSWQFETGDGVCILHGIEMSEGVTFTDPADVSPVVATPYSQSRSSGIHQYIQPVPGVYAWEWNWNSSEQRVATVSESVVNDLISSSQVVDAGSEDGITTVSAIATITDDSALELGVRDLGRSVVGSVEFASFFCENPWPNTPENGYEFIDHDTDEADPLGGGTPTNFATRYCRDSSPLLPELSQGAVLLPGRGDLPMPVALKIFPDELSRVVIASEHNVPELIKEFLFTSNLQDGVTQEGIGIRVMSNPRRISVRDWYNFMEFDGNPTPMTGGVDGYEAIRDNNTVYISALNIVGEESKIVYGNIYIISISEGATAGLHNVYDQLIENMRFNVNINNSKVCGTGADEPGSPCSNDLECSTDGTVECFADRDKLKRDLTRLNHVSLMNSFLEKSKTINGSYPTLDSGTFIRGMTNSRWPSWQAAFGSDLGTAVPQDPINLFTNGCEVTTGTCGDRLCSNIASRVCAVDSDCNEVGTYDASTCWNELSQTYRCPENSHIYQYQSIGGARYNFIMSFERIERSDDEVFWDVPEWPDNTSLNTIQVNGEACNWSNNTTGTIFSNSEARCGDGILSPATEDCEVGQIDEETVSFSRAERAQLRCSADLDSPCEEVGSMCGNRGICAPIASCTAQRSCTTSCKWDSWDGGAGAGISDCISGGVFCGNGIIDGTEMCDDGLLNGEYGHCGITCLGAGDRCGDGRSNGSEVCDEGRFNGGYDGNCRFDCSGYGPSCGDGIVQREWEEQCEPGDPPERTDRQCMLVNPLTEIGNAGQACTANNQCDSGLCGYCDTPGIVVGLGSAEPYFNSDGHLFTMNRSCTSNCKWPTWPISIVSVFEDLPTWNCSAQDVCGNGTLDVGEECDDGNYINDDGCTNNCERGSCGDGFNQESICVDSGDPDIDNTSCSSDSECGEGICTDLEECDVGSDNGDLCDPVYNGTCTYCDTQCNIATLSGGFCGDTVLQPSYEQCENNVGLERYICKGEIGETDRFWNFEKQCSGGRYAGEACTNDSECPDSSCGNALSGWNTEASILNNLFTHASGGYNSNSALKITNRSSTGKAYGARFENAVPSISNVSYTLSGWVNEGNSNMRGKRAKISLVENGLSQGCDQEVIIDDNPATWQYISCSKDFGSSIGNIGGTIYLYIKEIKNNANLVSVLFDQVHLYPTPISVNLSCNGVGCRGVCRVGEVCEERMLRCNGGANIGGACSSNDDCPGVDVRCVSNNFDRSHGYLDGVEDHLLFPCPLAVDPTWDSEERELARTERDACLFRTRYQGSSVEEPTRRSGQYYSDSISDSCDNDRDNDGYPPDADCDDNNAKIHPDASLVRCLEGDDYNCNGIDDYTEEICNAGSVPEGEICDPDGGDGGRCRRGLECVWRLGEYVCGP